MMREFDFIAMLTQRFGTTGPGLIKGIGDDCAHLELPPSVVQLATTDMLGNGIHFSDRFMNWQDIGWRSAAVNLSDLAASGADPDLPLILLLSLAVPAEMEKEQLIAFIDGVSECADRYNARVAGGDSTSTLGPFCASITALGYTATPVARDGAAPKDLLCVFGAVGAAGVGLEILETGKKEEGRELLVKAFLRPTPLLTIGYALGSTRTATSMIDVSDGILADAGHLARQSGCDVEIRVESLPIPESALSILSREKALEIASAFGDDYALLCSVPEERISYARNLAEKQGVPFAVIGRFSPGSGTVTALLDGTAFSVMKSGYQHRLGR